MRVTDVQKFLKGLNETIFEAVDHFADRFEKGAEKLGEEYLPLAEFAGSWKKLSKDGRKLFVEQLLKSAGLVVASSVATKAGIKTAWKNQKQVQNVLLMVADFIAPAATKAKKTAKETKKKVKKLKKKK